MRNRALFPIVALGILALAGLWPATAQTFEIAGDEASSASETASIPQIPTGLTATQLQSMVDSAVRAYSDAHPGEDPGGLGGPVATIYQSVLGNLDKIAPSDLDSVLGTALSGALGEFGSAPGEVTKNALEVAANYPAAVSERVIAAAALRAATTGGESQDADISTLLKAAAEANAANPALASAIIAGVAQSVEKAASNKADAYAQNAAATTADERAALMNSPLAGAPQNPDSIADSLMKALAATQDPVARAALARSLGEAIAAMPTPGTVVAAIVKTGIADTSDEAGPNQSAMPKGAASDINAMLASTLGKLAEEGRTSDLTDVAKQTILASAATDYAVQMQSLSLVESLVATLTEAGAEDETVLNSIGAGLANAVRTLRTEVSEAEARAGTEIGSAYDNEAISWLTQVADAVRSEAVARIASYDDASTPASDATKGAGETRSAGTASDGLSEGSSAAATQASAGTTTPAVTQTPTSAPTTSAGNGGSGGSGTPLSNPGTTTTDATELLKPIVVRNASGS